MRADIIELDAHRVALRREPARWFTAFPATTILALEYGLLAVWPAWRNDSNHMQFILWISALGLFAVFVGEALMRPLLPAKVVVSTESFLTGTSAKGILILGFLAAFVSSYLGARTYATQVGSTTTSPYAALFTPFIPWVYIGTAFLLYCYARGDLTRRNTQMWLVGADVAMLAYAIKGGVIAPFATYSIATVVTAVLVGLVRTRTLIIFATAALIAWPTIQQVRNDVRKAVGAEGTYGAELTASERLREDILLDFAAGFPESLHLGQPSAPTIARYGLIPRAIDPFPRPELPSGKVLSQRVGFSGDSTLTFTVFGNIRALGGGTVWMFINLVWLAAFLSLLRRRLTPLRLAYVLSMFVYVFWIEAGWPDPVAGLIQTLLASAAALLLIKTVQTVNAALAPAHRPAI